MVVMMSHSAVLKLLRASAFLSYIVALPTAVHADTYPIVPHTKLRVTVVQWISLKGEYQRWDAVSGDFTVSENGSISIPLIGSVTVTDEQSSDLALKISQQIKAKTGLIDPPNASVEVLEYPPVYIVGNVTTPGAYPFRPGLTVLQALALSGGRYRSPSTADVKSQIGMVGDLKGIRDDILRAVGRIARLQAEVEGAGEVKFPADLTSNSDRTLVTEILAQEKAIFSARANALKRQIDNLNDLQALFSGEIEILGQKTENLDRNIKLVEEELANVKSLVERGIATVSRRSELERAVAALQSGRLDEVTAAMRARQSLSETTRNKLSFRDQYHTTASTELQEAQVNLERLKIKEEIVTRTLVFSEISSLRDNQADEKALPDMSYIIIRNNQHKAEQIVASEMTSLAPGDVVKVLVGEPHRGAVNDGTANPSQ